MQEYVMGNGAIALGALAAGVNLVSGYPGTPSSEIVETISKYPHDGVHLEWSVNEKAAMEVAASAAYGGARTMVTMKQVGLNVAADPLMSLAYVGVKGGMVVVSADDPGPISSQTEQDTRRFADFARIPVFDPSSPEEAYEMIQDAFAYSEKYKTPVLFRPTTRVCHAYASIENPVNNGPKAYDGFVKDSKKWVIFPRLSYMNHAMIEQRNVEIGKDFSTYKWNCVEGGNSKKAVITSGISYAYAKEYLKDHTDIKLIKLATAYPLPEDFLLQALEGVEELLCVEDFAHALPMICRGNGHVTTFWSVGEHCICCAKEAAARGYSRRLVLACLLHDASECYMSDVPRPLKQEMPRYREIEDHLLSVIYEKYLGSDLTAEEQRMMKQIDNDLLWYDLTNLLEEPQAGDAPKLHITLDYTVRPFAAVEQEYLELFEQYWETGDERG